MQIRFLGHACLSLEHDGTTVLIDPVLTGNPKAGGFAEVVVLEPGRAHLVRP